MQVLVVTTVDEFAAARGATDPAARAAGLAHVSLAGITGDRPGSLLDPATLGRLACDAALQRVLLAPNGAVLHLGRSVRLASAAQRKALTARDQGCVIPGCGVPPDHCDVHHVTRWAAGGLTDIDTMVLVCPREHTGIHAGIWKIAMRDGIPWVTRPAWADPDQIPLRNTTHQTRHRARQAAQHLGQQLRLPLAADTDPDAHPFDRTRPTHDPDPETAAKLREWWNS